MKTFDKECWGLACYFLDDVKGVTEKAREELARRIQQTVDDFGEELAIEADCARDEHIDRLIDERRDEREYYQD